jgi:hypothetical protein
MNKVVLRGFLLLGSAALCLLAQGSLNTHGSVRTRLPAWFWFEAPGNNDYVFSGSTLRLSLGQQRKRFDWLVEPEVPVLLGLPDNATAPAPQGQLGLGANYFDANESRNAIMLFPRQAYVRLKSAPTPRSSLRFGRFEFAGGEEVIPKNPTLAWLDRNRIAQRLIGPYNWSYAGRSFDGAEYTWSRAKVNFTAMGALATRGAFQVNGWRNLNVAIGYGALTGQTAGNRNAGEWSAFGIFYDDWRGLVKTDNRPLPLRQADPESIRIGTFGGDYISALSTGAGTFDALVWAAGQVGAWGQLNHRAAAVAVEGGWQPRVMRTIAPWVRAGYFFSTGDDDPLDGTHGTFFQLLPTPRIYARFPFFNLMNLRDTFVMLILRPGRAFNVRADAHDLRLSNRNDLWYAGGGAFQPQTFGYTGRPSGGNRGLANLYDVSVDYRAGARLLLTGYFGYAVGRLVIRNIYPAGKNGALAYFELNYAF